MAEDLKITLETKLQQAKEDVKAIQGAGGLTGPSGAKALNKIQALFDTLSKQDISKLDADGLKRWLNDFSKLSHYIQSAGRGLSTYSAAYVKQQQKVEEANEALSKAQDKETEALRKQQEALKKFGESKATFYNDKGRKVSNPETVARLYEQNKLDIRDSAGQNSLSGAALASVQNTISGVLTANKDVQIAQQEVKAAEVVLKTERVTLEGMPSGGDTHPVTTQVDTHTAENYDVVQDIKENINATQSQTNRDLSDDIGKNINALNKQSTSLGKAFKQFSIYAIALRTVKKAINEATRTIKDLDKYLTTQAMVTGKTRKETYELLKTYQNMASQLGATTKEVAEVATQFMRQGKTAADAMKLTEAAISAAKVAGIGVTDSVNYLTTALNGFQLSAQDAMKVSDKFASIAAQSATSYDEIATALSKVAAQANMAGMSIDYTTAILAKGIETTREAPETIGTALKTIIARMRELTDYGATLEDGMNINNVEKQLSYVGIALRTETGELRSTEDVLDELGRKWTELSSNQQAAVAKALAGTRQQSRLIAMMTDYERVIELQQIAQRSAGATAAQAATYMEGMEAALNKVNVAWEKIVTTLTNSDVIINVINGFGSFLDVIGTIFESTNAIIPIIILVLMKTTEYIGLKLKEQEIAKQTQRLNAEIALKEIQAKKQEQEAIVEQLKVNRKAEKEKIDNHKREQLAILKENKLKAEGILNDKNATEEQKRLAQETINNYAQEEQAINQKAEADKAAIDSTIDLEEKKLQLYKDQEQMQASQLSAIESLSTAWAGYAGIFSMVAHKFSSLVKGVQQGIKVFQEAGKHEASSSAAVIPVVGWIIWAIIEGIAIIAAAKNAIQGFMNWVSQWKEEEPAKKVNELSNEIYKMTEKSNNLKQIISDFEAIDNKIIKTKQDIEELNTLLDKAADKLDEKEKEDYAKLVTQDAKIKYLKQRQEAADIEAKSKRDEQIRLIANNQYLLTGTSSDALSAQSALIANNNDAIYRYIDTIEDVADGIEYFTQSIFENMDALSAYRYATEGGRKQLERVIDVLNSAKNADQIAYAEILNSEDYTLTERLDAYKQLLATLEQIGDPALTKSLRETYKQWEMLGESFSYFALEFVEQYDVTIDELNDLSKALQKLGYDAEESAVKLNDLLTLMASGEEISNAIWSVFGVAVGTDEYLKILNAYQKAVGRTILDIGQNLQSFKSQINSVYEMVGKWGSLSDSEKTQFLNENADLFKGSTGEKLYEAFKTGNYDVIEQALRENEYLQKQLGLRKQELQVQLDIEKAREGTEEYDIATVQYLEEQLALLKDMEKIFKADLKLRVDQENAQLDIYKTYLQKQQDALTESLEKRKDAYQKYFDAINQEAEDENYEEQANTLITNLSKLSSSTNADAMKQSKELEKQLEELEKERLNTLRERAQEAIMQNLEDEVSQINEKFDKLLENNQAVLQMMRQDLTNPEQFVADMLSSNVNNMTALGAEQWIEETLKAAFGSKINSSILDDITVRENGNNLTLNIAGQTIDLGEASQKDLADTILRALRQLGISI